ncbi:MAG: hypothetical protein QJR09_02730 [Micrococcus sp.]|nr:hypothetical protein [Micrococcus sp.]
MPADPVREDAVDPARAGVTAPAPSEGAGSMPRRRGGRRGHRRADAEGTGPAAADGPEPRLEVSPVDGGKTAEPSTETATTRQSAPVRRLSERDRWILEQRPPHWG